jgi:hypothetical protein
MEGSTFGASAYGGPGWKGREGARRMAGCAHARNLASH